MNYRFPEKVNWNARNLILEVAEKGQTIPGFISLAMGNPAEEAIPVELIRACAAEVLAEDPIGLLQYGPMAGDADLLRWVKDRMVHGKGCAAEGNQVILLSGSGKGLGLMPRTMCQEGDEVYCDAFCFLNTPASVRNVGAIPVGIPSDDQGMIPEALEERAKSGKGKYIYLIPNFHNPMGITIPLERRKELYEVAAKYDLLIYEDDPYGDIRFAGEPVPSFKSMDTDGRVVYAGSFSKTLSAGLRVGFLYAPDGLIRKFAAVKSADGQEPMLNQRIISRCLSKLDFNEYLKSISQIYGRKCALMAESLRQHCSPRCRVLVPEGGLFIWVEMPADVDMDAVNDAVIDAGVGVVRSAAFAVDESEPGHAFCLNFSALPDDKIARGAEIFGRVTRQFCDKI